MGGFDSPDLVGRMTPQGWLLIQHLNRCSAIITDPKNDSPGLDAETTWTWVLTNSKVKTTKAFLDAKTGWASLQEELENLRRRAAGMRPAEMEALRLDIRMRQSEVLVSAAVEAHMLDVASLPVDDQTKR